MKEPLTTPDVDLRNFAFMPLDVVRLRDSDLVAQASDAAFRAAVLLWCAAWHQVPAGSLPDDERALAHLSGFGRDLRSWRSVRDEALRGFEKCSDDRLYHPVIAEKAIEAWNKKQAFKKRTAAARATKAAKASVTEPETDDVAGHKGQGTGDRGQGQATAAKAAAATPPPPGLDDLRRLCVEAAGRDFPKGFGLIVELYTQHSLEDRILPIIRDATADAEKAGETIRTWAYFAQPISDPLRASPGAPAPLVAHVWCEAGSPEFERGNAARIARGEEPWRGLPSRHHDRKGASFPAADVRDDRAQA